jgi:hypothetical protein
MSLKCFTLCRDIQDALLLLLLLLLTRLSDL